MSEEKRFICTGLRVSEGKVYGKIRLGHWEVTRTGSWKASMKNATVVLDGTPLTEIAVYALKHGIVQRQSVEKKMASAAQCMEAGSNKTMAWSNFIKPVNAAVAARNAVANMKALGMSDEAIRAALGENYPED